MDLILSFRHKGLERLYRRADEKGLPIDLASKIERVLARLDVASSPEMINLPGLRLHPLKGELKGFWSVRISGNWRIIFRFDGSNVADVDLVDYH